MVKIIDLRGKTMDGGDRRSISRINNIAVHYSATDQGDVQLAYNPDVISNGVLGHNTATYNICYVGKGVPNAKQLKALKERVNYNRKRFNVALNNVKGHREFSNQSTACPALDMNGFRKSLDDTNASQSNTSQPSTTKPKTKPKATGNSRIKTIQSTLNSRYNTGLIVDGIDGRLTKAAIIKGYQTELNKQFNAGLVVDGIWGTKTRNASVTVRRGATGRLTWIIQARLYCLGYDPKGLDSIFGGGLYEAVRKFQADKGIGVDGTPGKATFGKLFG